jgi:Ca-activated chloride channel family protein
LSVLSTHPAGEDGYLMLRLRPGRGLAGRAEAAKNLLLVLDTSGSMEGEKLKQARIAAQRVLAGLGERDRFGLLTYAAGLRWLSQGLEEVDADSRRRVATEVENLQAGGGTNIEAALDEALAEVERSAQDAPTYVLFLSDGLPTVGERDAEALLRRAERAAERRIRIFTFGVGVDVDTRLMDGLAARSRALARYVLPGEDLQESVGSLAAQIARPLITDLRLELPGADLHDLEPGSLGDLFRGDEVVVLARYRQAGRHRLRLQGRRGERPWSLEQEVTLAPRATAHDWLPRLWAVRRIASLQQALRRAGGEDPELVEEIVTLGLRHGIVTAYTSLLAEEPGLDLAQRQGRIGEVLRARPRVLDLVREKADRHTGADAVTGAAGESRAVRAPSLASGERALRPDTSVAEQRLRVGRWTFRRDGRGCWIEAAAEGREPDLRLLHGSDAFFALADLRPALRPALALGPSLRMEIGALVVEIGDEGKTALAAEDRERLAP